MNTAPEQRFRPPQTVVRETPERARHVTGWWVGAVFVAQGSAALLALPALESEPVEIQSDPTQWIGAFYLACALVLLAIGVGRARRNPPELFVPRLGHTIAIGVVAGFMGLNILAESLGPPQTPDVSGFVVGLFGLHAACGLTVVALRTFAPRSPFARPATAALEIAWAPLFPLGTAVFLWWIVSVRKQEQPVSPD